ncbi:Uncharacterized protein BM_BM2332 [Brugia malayi]|uniref:Bm2332 n=2 Tax=Brugia TaxID=6278 RepID=A0A0H5S4W3_BRUMA|nr:Uncharacterized protein BM_BM2332 [Brugia malayi]CRZ23477.1 Bm2332 [Brugia malayi]VDN83551.1 unnamed protein product [Brugia pahangi]VIO89552.1 Uncharacterized protein BM_BM2332 [Brugia malayi]
MVDLKQQLDMLDYLGPIAVWISFFSITFIISVTCILWCCVSETDDKTVFAKWGMGPRHQLTVAQQKYDSTSTHKAL